MKHLEGKLFRVADFDSFMQRMKLEALLDTPKAFPICGYILVKEVRQCEHGQWMFHGVDEKGQGIVDRTVFLNYYDEVTDPTEIILFSPRNEKKAPSPTRGE